MSKPDTVEILDSEEEIGKEEKGEEATSEEAEEEIEEGEFSIHDIEEFLKATEVWDKLLKGEIKVETLRRVKRVTKTVKRRRRK
ncbi:MAG TPA: RNA polymerase Rpo13 [Desulfurococcales archaeon]|nr:RNA polymerase Rpo13 [Desulfurococcales archaeon]